MTGTPRLFAIVGPSGAGKDTLIAGALAAWPDLRVVRRVITRPTEAGGEPFEGVSEQEFDHRKARGEFALDWQAHGLRYAIPRAQVDAPGTVIFNGSRGALAQATQVFPGLCVVLVTAPEDVLAHRLAARGREDPGGIRQRLARAPFALPPGISAVTVVNDGTEAEGVARLLAALQPVSA